jgi:hypothetical protein
MVTFTWGRRTLLLKFSLANIILDKWRSKFAKTKWWGSVNDTEWFSSPHGQFLVSRYIITAGLSDIPVLFDYVPFCADARKEAHHWLYFAFQSFDFEYTWWRFFKKRVVCTKFDMYGFVFNWNSSANMRCSKGSPSEHCIKYIQCSVLWTILEY